MHTDGEELSPASAFISLKQKALPRLYRKQFEKVGSSVRGPGPGLMILGFLENVRIFKFSLKAEGGGMQFWHRR